MTLATFGIALDAAARAPSMIGTANLQNEPTHPHHQPESLVPHLLTLFAQQNQSHARMPLL
jgi:hypothetical protein